MIRILFNPTNESMRQIFAFHFTDEDASYFAGIRNTVMEELINLFDESVGLWHT